MILAQLSQLLNMKDNSLKKENQKYLWMYIGVNIAVIACIVLYKTIKLYELEKILKTFILSPGTILFILSPLISLLINGILPANWKNIIVFWRFKNPLPGCRAFTILINKDARIDKKKLKKVIGKFPIEPKKQNKLWYKLFKKYENNVL
jgi:hypothetical protein